MANNTIHRGRGVVGLFEFLCKLPWCHCDNEESLFKAITHASVDIETATGSVPDCILYFENNLYLFTNKVDGENIFEVLNTTDVAYNDVTRHSVHRISIENMDVAKIKTVLRNATDLKIVNFGS